MLKRGKGTPLHSRATKGDCNRYEKREKAFRPAADAAAGLHGTAASGSRGGSDGNQRGVPAIGADVGDTVDLSAYTYGGTALDEFTWTPVNGGTLDGARI